MRKAIAGDNVVKANGWIESFCMGEVRRKPQYPKKSIKLLIILSQKEHLSYYQHNIVIAYPHLKSR